MSADPTIVCPSCRTEIKLTESLAAPLIEATRKQYESKIAQQNADVAKRERAVKDREASLAAEKAGVDAAVAAKIKVERDKRYRRRRETGPGISGPCGRDLQEASRPRHRFVSTVSCPNPNPPAFPRKMLKNS